jgi:hypothetical protein
LKYRLAALLLIASILAPPRAIMAAQTPDEELYTKTVATMRALAQPANLTFITSVESDGIGRIDLIDRRGYAGIGLGIGGGKARAAWPVSYRTNDDLASIVNRPDHHLISHSPIFSPTWDGVYDWMRYGISGRPNRPATATPEPAAQPQTGTDAGAVVIGMAQVISINFYRITQADALPCPSGSEGRHLHLEPRAEPLRHPLTDVTIDTASGRFCSMRFHLEIHSLLGFALNATATEEIHFGDVNGYWMTTSSDSDILERTFGIGLHHATLHFTYQDVRFPDRLEEALFVPQV